MTTLGRTFRHQPEISRDQLAAKLYVRMAEAECRPWNCCGHLGLIEVNVR